MVRKQRNAIEDLLPVGIAATLLFAALPSAALAGGALRYAEDRAPAIVNPLFATSMSEARLNELLFDGLFTDDLELRSTPRLAESLEVAADRKSMTLKLRSDVRWHDGEPFTSRDVVFTIKAMKDAGTASSEAGRVAWIRDVQAVDAHTLRILFHGEEYAPQDKLHFKILPAHAFRGTTVKRSDPFRNRPVGTGAFNLVSFNSDNSITLQRNTLATSEPGLDTVTMREVSDKNYQAKLLVYESLEALVRVLPRDLATLQAVRKVELYPYQTNSWWYIGFNHQDPRLQEHPVREAIASMIDVPALLAPVGTGDLLTGPFVTSSPFYNHDVQPRRHDPNRGAELLASAGYVFNGKQWIGPDGKNLTLRVATMQNLETAQDVLINLQSQLQSRGIGVEPEFLGTAEWKERIWRDRNYDAVLGLWSFDRNEDVYEQFHSKGSRNFVAYANPEVDRLLDEARQAADPQQKKHLLRQVHAMVAADTPMVFLWTLDSYSALSTKVKNVVVHPFYFFTWARDWTID